MYGCNLKTVCVCKCGDILVVNLDGLRNKLMMDIKAAVQKRKQKN